MTMLAEQAPITGKELPQQLTPQMRTLSQFYRALNTRNMELMAHRRGPPPIKR